MAVANCLLLRESDSFLVARIVVPVFEASSALSERLRTKSACLCKWHRCWAPSTRAVSSYVRSLESHVVMGSKKPLVLDGIVADSVFSLAGSFVLKALPILSGMLLARMVGKTALEMQNALYVYLSLATTFIVGGMSPFITFALNSTFQKPSDSAEEVDRIWWSSIKLFNFMFLLAVSLILVIRGPVSSIDLVLLAAIYFTILQALFFLRESCFRNYRQVFWASLAWSSAVPIIYLALIFFLRFPTQLAIYSGYVLASVGVVIWFSLQSTTTSPGTRTGFFSKSELTTIASYELTQLLTVGVIFASLAFVHQRTSQIDFNTLIFAYQVYSFIIYAPGLMTNVIVNHLNAQTSSASRKQFQSWFQLTYLSFGFVVTVLIALCFAHLMQAVFHQNSEIKMDYYFILFSAVPSTLIAGFNQINIFKNRPSFQMISAIVFALVFSISLLSGALINHFGATLLLSLSSIVATNIILDRMHSDA
jgi:hypothetical protein